MPHPVALVTGGSRGIGFAVAAELVSCGYRVVLVAKDPQKLELARRKLAQSAAVEPECLAVDVCDVARVREVVREVERRHDRIDLLFNGAGVSIVGTLDMETETFDQLMDINLRAPFVFMQEVVPVMLRRGEGYIINVASRNAKVAVASLGGYSASKYGLMGLGEAVYRDLAARGISVSTICPGWVNTDMAAHEGASLPQEEMIQPEDIARTVRWLLSLSPSVRVMEVMLECAGDVERRGSVELAKLRELRRRHPDEYNSMDLEQLWGSHAGRP